MRTRFFRILVAVAVLASSPSSGIGAGNLTLSTAGKNAALASITALINAGGAGSMKIYGGVQPASPNVALSGQTLLVSLSLSPTAFAAPLGGTVTANPIAPGSPVANGTATWFRIYSGANSPVIDGRIATSGADLNLASVSIIVGQNLTIDNFSLTHP